MFKIKRSDQDPDGEDGFRILVDNVWPGGLSEKNAKFDIWMKEIAPSKKLGNMFGQDPEKFNTFKKQYLEELKDKKELIKQLKILEKFNHTITLVYTAKDQDQNYAVVLLELLKKPAKQIVMDIPRIHG